MGTETTSATYRRTQTHESQSFSTKLLEPKELTANIWHIHPKKQCCPPKRQLSPHLRNLTIKTRVLFHILFVEFHFHLFDANRFGIPVFIRKSFAGSGYKCASIRHVSFTCRYFCGFVQAGAPANCKLFRINYWKPKTFHQTHKNPPTQQFFCTNPPQYAILISIK